jgi:phosphate transport system substrate-binding protein
MRLFRMITYLLAVSICLSSTSCSTGPTELKTATAKQALNGAGATFPNPLYQKWAAEYAKEGEGAPVEYQSVGSGKGVELFLSDSVDFGASDSAMTDEQINQAKQGALLVPSTAGMIVLAYNPEGLPKILRLKRDVYSDIFLGKITKWNDPRIAATNPGHTFPDKSIALVVRQDRSGTTFAFTNHLSSISKEWKSGPGVGTSLQWPATVLPAAGNEGVVGMIKRTPYSIGYSEYGEAKSFLLSMAELENRAGQFIKPAGGSGLEALLAAKIPDNFRAFVPDPEGEQSYPIITYTWILAKRKYHSAEKAGSIRRFLEWCLTDGQKDCESLGFVRLPPALAQRALIEVRKIQ